jgi:hypothetical protein
LIVFERLCTAAYEHTKDIGLHGIKGNISSNNELFTDRINKFGDWNKDISSIGIILIKLSHLKKLILMKFYLI